MDRGSQTPSLCPPGFSLIEGPDNIPILVPDYMVLATKAALESQSVRMELNADEAAPGVRIAIDGLQLNAHSWIFSRGLITIVHINIYPKNKSKCPRTR